MLNKALGLALALICATGKPSVLYAADRPGSVDAKPSMMSPEIVSNFFDATLEADRFVWVPQRQGLSRYGFTIPRQGFRSAQTYQDSSDLFYLSDLRDYGLAPSGVPAPSWTAVLGKDSIELGVEGSWASGYRAGLRVQSRDGTKIQGMLRRQLVVSEQSVVRLSTEIDASSALRLVGEAVSLARHENSELFVNVAVGPGGGLLWGEVGKTWFDLGSNLDLSTSAYRRAGHTDGKVLLHYDQMKYQISFGVQDLFSTSPSLALELAFHPKRQGGVHSQIVIRNSDLDEPWLGFRRQSLKSLRRVEMVQAWRDGMGFERNK